MDANKILAADLLDILFDGRNKLYGAYELRRKYDRRLTLALLIAASLPLAIMLVSFVLGKTGDNSRTTLVRESPVKITGLRDLEKTEPRAPMPPSLKMRSGIKMDQFSSIRMVKEDIRPEEVMKDVDDLKYVEIGTTALQSKSASDITNPPIQESSGVIMSPKKTEDTIAYFVQVPAGFPGGEGAWNKYIKKEIEKYIDELQDAGVGGTCVVQFIVDKEGNISDVEALTMKGTKLAEICTNAVKKGPKWTPAEQNGRKVKAYCKQPVTFQIEEQ